MIFFALTNILVSFQRYINKIFNKKLDIFNIIYLNDNFIYIDNDGDGYIIAIHWVLK